MQWIYISPHLDDVTLSCGGLVWAQVQAGDQVQIWTVCAGDAPAGPLSPFAEALHTRWQTAPGTAAARRQEDAAACRILGAIPQYFATPDCVYRRGPHGAHLYAAEEALFSPLHPSETALAAALARDILARLPAQAVLVSPLALGGHVDHRLARVAAERVQAQRPDRPIWYYADYPYVLRQADELAVLTAGGWQATGSPLSAPARQAWTSAVAAYASQLSTFWPTPDAMQVAIQAYADQMGGGQLWQPPIRPV